MNRRGHRDRILLVEDALSRMRAVAVRMTRHRPTERVDRDRRGSPTVHSVRVDHGRAATQ
eukprot:1993235-Prymnesium_polylepis.2